MAKLSCNRSKPGGCVDMVSITYRTVREAWPVRLVAAPIDGHTVRRSLYSMLYKTIWPMAILNIVSTGPTKPQCNNNMVIALWLSYYASVGGVPRHTVVIMFVCVCVVLQHAFLGDRDEVSNESCNATTAINWHSITAKLARFLLMALLSSYSVMYSPWWLLSAIESPAKSNLPTTNYIRLESSICATR